MEMDRFKSLPRIKNQEGRVDDTEKAEQMALREKMFREHALEYKKYLENPDRFTSQDNPTSYLAENFVELQKAGITPENIEQVSTHVAERFGALYDLQQKVPAMSDIQLSIEFVRAVSAMLLGYNKQEQQMGIVEPITVRGPAPDITSYSLAWEKEGIIEKEWVYRRKWEGAKDRQKPTDELDLANRPPLQ